MITYGTTTLTSYNSIASTEVYYYKSTSATALSGGSWSTTKPTWENGKYIWQKIRTLYEDETYTESDPVNITGQQGATGTAAYSYKLNASDTIIGKLKTGEYTVNSITFSATSKQGTGAVTAYAGRFKIETTTNGINWTTSYSSSANESSKEFTIPENIISIKCSLYQAGGMTVLLDIMTIPIVKDGVDAIGLRDSIPIYLASNKATGVTKLDQGWTRFRPELTAEKKYLWVYYVSRYSEGDTEPELIEIKDDVVSFINNGDISPVENCIVDINPIQDFNGYDRAWSEGYGKNLIKFAKNNIENIINGVTAQYDLESDIITITGTNTKTTANYSALTSYIFLCNNLEINSTYTLSIHPITTNTVEKIYVQINYVNTSGTTKNLVTTSGNYSFIVPSDFDHITYVFIGIQSAATILNYTFKIQLEKGSVATSWVPYDANICSVYGRNDITTARIGKNLFDINILDLPNLTIEGNTVSGTGSVFATNCGNGKLKDKILFPKKQGVPYTFSFTAYTDANSVETTNNGLGIYLVYTDGSDIRKYWKNNQKTPLRQFMTSDPQKEISFFSISFGNSGGNIWHLSDIQIELGDEATEYEPYQQIDYYCSVESEENKNLIDFNKEPYLFKKSNPNQIKILEENIVGGTVCWNQLIQNGNFDNSGNNWDSGQYTKSVANNIMTVTIPENPAYHLIVKQNAVPGIANHKYLFSAKIKSSFDIEQFNFRLGTENALKTSEALIADSWIKFMGVISAPSTINTSVPFTLYCLKARLAEGTIQFKEIQCFDLTQMFGVEIADYIYSLEQSEDGAGVTWFKKYFPHDFYEYNAGEMLSVNNLQSHDIIGFNLWDEEWEAGTYDPSNGAKINNTVGVRSKNLIPVFPETEYCLTSINATARWRVLAYDSSGTYVGYLRYDGTKAIKTIFATKDNTRYIRFSTDSLGSIYNNDICFNISCERDGDYEPYNKYSYSLDSSLTLRGLPKLDANNNLYYDGDIYKPDGTVKRHAVIKTFDGSEGWTRVAGTQSTDQSYYRCYLGEYGSVVRNVGLSDKYPIVSISGSTNDIGFGIFNSSATNTALVAIRPENVADIPDATSFKAFLAANPVTVVYLLADGYETTEHALPYTSSQTVTDYSTEEYITDSIIPVGHETNYYNNTVYGGQYNITTGELTVTHDVVDLESLTYLTRYTDTNNKVLSVEFPIICNDEENDFLLAENYPIINSVTGAAALSSPDSKDRGIYWYSNPNNPLTNTTMIYIVCGVNDTPKGKLVIRKSDEFKKYSLTPQEVTMLTGQNHVYADSGEVSVSYYDNQKTTVPYVDYATTTALEASINAFSNALGTLEAPYTEVEWVESTGKQYIYLDWKPPINTWGFEADFICRNANNTTSPAWNEETNINGYGVIFGTRNASGVNDVEFGSYNNGTLRIGNGTNQATGFKLDHSRQTVKLRGNIITKADDTTSTITRLSETPDKKYCNMVVFALYEGLRRAATGGLIYPTTTRIYSLKFYDEDTLTVDLVGAIRKRDKVTGLYDKVSKHFYPAAGMLYGEEIGDIGNIPTVTESVEKANIRTTVVNKGCSRMWEASVPLEQLEDGQKITVVYSYGDIVSSLETDRLIGWDETKSNSYVYLKLNLLNGKQTDWIPCYYSQTTRLTTHYGAGIPILFTYRENVLSSATATTAGSSVMRGFFADANYNVDNNTVGVYGGTVVAGANGVKKYSLIMKDTATTWTSFTTNSGDGTAKTRYTGGLYPDKILYMGGSSDYAATKTTGTCYEALALSLRYSTNCGTTLITSKPVYLVGELHDDGLFYLDETWWTQTVPTEEDDKIYIYLGMAYSNYQIYLATENPMYQFYNGEFILYSKVETLKNLEDLRDELESQIDGKVETWCQSTNPATAWTTTELKNQHNGDLWYYTGESTSSFNNNTTYKYVASNNTWTEYSANTDLFDKIDAKTSIYYGTTSSITTAEQGDYLVDNTDGSSYRWNNGGWVKVTDYKTAIDNIEVGGRNLARNTKGAIIDRIGSEAGSRKEYTTFNLGCELPLNDNDPISISFDLYMEVNTAIPMLSVYNTNNKGPHQTCLQTNVLAGNNYQVGDVIDKHIAFVSAITDRVSPTATNDYLEFYSNYGSNNFYRISNLKVEKGNKPTDWTPAPEDIENSIQAYVSTIQTQVDGMAEIHYGTVVPSLSNTPASAWTDTDTKDLHIDDLYYNTSTGYCYRFTKSGSTYSWNRIKDSDITSAATAASNANTLAGQKKRVFVTQPTPPYEVGDLWVEGSNGDIKKCKTAKASGSYAAADWELASKYTDDTLASTANDKIDNLEIGGRNLLINSESFKPSQYPYTNSVVNKNTNQPDPFDNEQCYYASGSSGYVQVDFPELEIGKQYIFSVEVARHSTGADVSVYIGIGEGINGERVGTATALKWKRFSTSFIATEETICANIRLYSTSGANSYVGFFRHFKLEQGTKSTDWTLAPEDLSSIEVGGRNLLQKSDCFTKDDVYSNSNTQVTYPEPGIMRIAPTSSTAMYGKFKIDYLNYKDYEKSEITVSFDARIPDIETTLTQEPIIRVCLAANVASRYATAIINSNYDYYGVKTITNLTNEWKRYQCSFSVADDLKIGKIDAAIDGNYLCLQFGQSSGRIPVEIRLIKMETGKIATAWTSAPEDIESEINSLETNLQSQIDEKIQTYYQGSNPALSWTTADVRAQHDGDLWYFTGDSSSTYTKDNVYRYNGSNNTWTTYSASGELFDKVDGKSTIYYGTTSGTYTGVGTGDYLVDGTDGSSYRYNGTTWVKVTDYKTAINNLEIGSRNLYINKNQVNGFIGTNGAISAQNATYKEHTSEYIPVSVGDSYILQSWNDDDLGSNTLWLGYLFYSDTAGTKVGSRIAKYGAVGDKYIAYDSIIVPEGAAYIRVSYRKFENGLVKLEKGNKATGWSPAPEDIDNSIQNVQDNLDNLEIGSRNLMLSSPVSYSPTAYSVYNIKLTEDLLADQTYTLQLWDVDVVNSAVTADQLGIAIYYCGGSVGIGSWIGTDYFTDGHADYLCLTFTLTTAKVTHSNVVNAAYKFIRLYNSKVNDTNATRNMSIGKWKLEKGNKGTDWTPAPEDVDQKIDNIEVGGRNYFKCFDNSSENTINNVEYTYDKKNGAYQLTVVNASTTGFKQIYTKMAVSNLEDILGQEVIMSISEITTSNANAKPRVYFYGTKSDGTTWLKRMAPEVEGLSISFTVESDLIKAGYLLRVDQDCAENAGDTAIFRGLKLEKGNKPTDWTPAPEDIENSIQNVQDTANTALTQSVEYIVGTQTAATGSWKGVTRDSELITGKNIAYKLPFAGSGNASLTLTLSNGTTTDAIAVYINTTRATTQFGANSVINMTYDGQYWRITSIPNTNNLENVIPYFTGKTGIRGIWRYSLFMRDGNGTYQNICTASDGTVTTSNSTVEQTKKANPSGFEVGSPIWYANGAGYNANTNISGNNAIYKTTSVIDSRYSLNTTKASGSLTPYLPVYLVGEVRSDNLFYLDTVWWTQTPTDSSKVYVLIGGCYDSTTSNVRITLQENNEWYKYVNGKLEDYSNRLAELASTTATAYITDITDNGIMVHPENDTTSGWSIASAIQLFKNSISYIKLWIENNVAKIRIGREDQGHILIDNNSVDIRDGQKIMASFGENTRIGQYNQTHLNIQNNGLSLESYNEDTLCRIGHVNSKIIEKTEEYAWLNTGNFEYYFPDNIVDGSEAIFNVGFLNGGTSATFNIIIGTSSSQSSNGISFVYDGYKGIFITCWSNGNKVGGWTEFTYSIYAINTCAMIIGNLAENVTDIGDKSISIGNSNQVDHKTASAIGMALKTGCDSQFLIGYNNIVDSSHAFAIGNGEYNISFNEKEEEIIARNENNASNAFSVTWDGNVEMALDTTALSGTIDGDFYAAITALGWEGDVIV